MARALTILALSVLGGASAWLVIPMMETSSDGTARSVGGWIDGLVPLGIALIAIGYAGSSATRSRRAGAVLPLLPFAATALAWAFLSGMHSGSDIGFALCLLGMPVLAVGGGIGAALTAGQPRT